MRLGLPVSVIDRRHAHVGVGARLHRKAVPEVVKEKHGDGFALGSDRLREQKDYQGRKRVPSLDWTKTKHGKTRQSNIRREG